MLPGAIIIFPMIYFMQDLIQEVYGYKRARQTLWVCIFVSMVSGASISAI
jgi:queuosine precursor transporter